VESVRRLEDGQGPEEGGGLEGGEGGWEGKRDGV
jgi:hypothetical protein